MKYLVLIVLLLAGCGKGLDSVCGVAYHYEGGYAHVQKEDIFPLFLASFSVENDQYKLLNGGFASSSDINCQFGVKDGVIYR